MIPKWLRNFAAGLFLLGSVGSIGVGAVDATGPENCSVPISAPAPSTGTNSANFRPVCRDNIDGDAQNYIFGGLTGIGGVAGINFLFPGLGGSGRTGSSSSGRPGRREEGEPTDEEARDDK